MQACPCVPWCPNVGNRSGSAWAPGAWSMACHPRPPPPHAQLRGTDPRGGLSAVCVGAAPISLDVGGSFGDDAREHSTTCVGNKETRSRGLSTRRRRLESVRWRGAREARRAARPPGVRGTLRAAKVSFRTRTATQAKCLPTKMSHGCACAARVSSGARRAPCAAAYTRSERSAQARPRTNSAVRERARDGLLASVPSRPWPPAAVASCRTAARASACVRAQGPSFQRRRSSARARVLSRAQRP